MDNKEVRYFDIRNMVDENENRTVEGYAIVFNSLSNDLGGFKEKILPSAIDCLQDNDILFLLNHDIHRGVIARYRQGEGSLHLEVDEKGVKFRFEAPHTSLGDELLEGLRRKDISQCSFAFSTPTDKSGEVWEKLNDGSYLRTITKFSGIYDCSAVYTPAYSDTTICQKRMLDIEAREKNDKLIEAYNNELNDIFKDE